MNKINSHLFVLKADTAHLLMQSVRCLKIICCKSDMTLILAQLIGLRMIFGARSAQSESCRYHPANNKA